MTAIGAVPAGGFPQPSAADIDALSADQVTAWAPDVWSWIVGPYTGATPLPVLQWRALALLGYAAHAAGTGIAMPGTQVVEPPARSVAEPHSPAGVVATNEALAASMGAQDQTGLVEPRKPAVTDPIEAPGSVDDPAYSSPTPVAGDRVEPRDPDAPGEGQQPVPESPAQP